MRHSLSQDRDGFHVLVEEFALPTDNLSLDPQSKRTVTICNLYVNHQYNISDVVRVLDEDRRHVIHALLKKGIIRDRRVLRTTSPEGIERRRTVVSLNVLQRIPKWQ